jgi:hypothetical protein
MVQFSRLQLAAASIGRHIFRLRRISLPPSSSTHFIPSLVEYDNDLDDLSKPLRSAQDSDIFAFLRHAYQEPPRNRNSVDYLGVPLPGDTTGIEGTSAPMVTLEELVGWVEKSPQWQLAGHSTIFDTQPEHVSG